MSIEDMVAEEKVERVERDVDGAVTALDEARLHIRSAGSIAETDANGAFQLAYDGARKAVMAHMRFSGLRVRRGEGAHALTAAYAEAILGQELGEGLERMRRRRNRSEYGIVLIRDEEIEEAIAIAHALVDRVAEQTP